MRRTACVLEERTPEHHRPGSSRARTSPVSNVPRRERTQRKPRDSAGYSHIGTDTPMGKLLQARQGDIAVLDAGRRAGTIGSRVRNIRHFLAWLAVNHGITYPADLTPQVRLSQPCNRGSLKITHESFVFLDVISGVESQCRLTNRNFTSASTVNSLSRALLGKATKQALGMFTAMLRGLEVMIMSNTFPLYFRIYAWWICVQSWATLRFDDSIPKISGSTPCL